MRSLRAAGLIAANDLRRRLRNRSFVIQAFVGPIVLALVISAAFGGGFGFDVTVGIVDLDRSELGTQLSAQLVDGGAEDVEFRAYATEAEARRAMDDGDIGAALVVPAGFQASLVEARPEALGILTQDGSAVSGAVARAVGSGVAARIDAARLAAAALVADGRPVPPLDELLEIELPVAIDQRDAGEQLSAIASVAPGMGMLFLFLTVAVVARSLLEERRQRVLDRILAAPVSISTILLGKAIGVVLVGCASLLTLWGATTLLLGASWGDPLAVVVLVVVASVAVAGIAGVVAGLARTEQAADLLATMTAFVFGILGGSMVPLSELPDGLVRISAFTPNGWAMRAFAELSAGGGTLVDIAPHLAVLAGWAAGGLVLGALLLPRRLVSR